MAFIPRIKLGTQGFEVSKLGLGCMGLSAFYGSPVAEEDGISLIHYAFNRGIIFFDTANVYGSFTNEVLVGKALKGFPREKVQRATKFANCRHITELDLQESDIDGHGCHDSRRRWRSLYHTNSSSTLDLTGLFLYHGLSVVCPHGPTGMLWAPLCFVDTDGFGVPTAEASFLPQFASRSEVGQAGYASGGDPGFGHGLLSAQGMSQGVVLGFPGGIFSLNCLMWWIQIWLVGFGGMRILTICCNNNLE